VTTEKLAHPYVMPMIELHLHLEGAIPHSALWELIQKYGGDSSLPNIESLARRFRYKDFKHFIETWIWKNSFIREYEDFTYIAEQFVLDLSLQKILYAEVHYSPAGFSDSGLHIQEITKAIRTGFDRVPAVEIALIIDLIRDLGSERASHTLHEVKEVKELGVIGMGLGGLESAYPAELFQNVYEDVHNFGFHTTAHAGEAAGAQSIWAALRNLKVERIGHGTRAFEDIALLDYLVENKIPLEMCPLSNVCTRVVNDIESHPIRRYFDRGIMVSISTDDPKMFGNTLAEEYKLLEKIFSFSPAEIRVLMSNAVQSCWLADEKKQHFLSMINSSWE
jgi:adenosine deaminase